MKFTFDGNLGYQQDAVDSVLDILAGLDIKQSNFSIESSGINNGLVFDSEVGVSNSRTIQAEEIFKNIKIAQKTRGLSSAVDQSEPIRVNIEMETGTGKTYVYFRTIFELNKKYGLSKFIIVVPSVAIKEGVLKSISMMNEHFLQLYKKVPYRYYEYKSRDLEHIRDFASSDNLRILVMTIQSFNKDSNVLNNEHELTSDLKPIELLRRTHPIVFLDEPQNMESEKSRQAISSLDPMLVLGYSATHRNKKNLIYKLDAVDAYNMQLVKQIEVASIIDLSANNRAYIELIGTSNSGSLSAIIEIEIFENQSIKRKRFKVRKNSDLYRLSNQREVYEGYIINDIFCESGIEYIDFTSRDEIVTLGNPLGGTNKNEIRRIQIRKTIEKHLDKELVLTKQGIKVLSLFFIDKVSNYRVYNNDGTRVKGIFAQIFEQEFSKLIKKPKYISILSLYGDLDNLDSIHNGYFALDSKKHFKDTSGTTAADEDVYNLIMRDKEDLLSFDTKLRFIFSHSALREGWDNPNIFQICTLNETTSEIKKRQEIGRGLRICVNQQGMRVHGFDVNTLTIMANESYDDFANALQKEICEDSGIMFGYINANSFEFIVDDNNLEKSDYLGKERSIAYYNFLLEQGYIDSNGKISNDFRDKIEQESYPITEDIIEFQSGINRLLKKIILGVKVKNADKRRVITVNESVLKSEMFTQLWNKIKLKTNYSINIDVDTFLDSVAKNLNENLFVSHSSVIYTEARLNIESENITTTETNQLTINVDEDIKILPDVITHLQNETGLTRKSIVGILIKSGKLGLLKLNPQEFINNSSKIIRNMLSIHIVNGISYSLIAGESYTLKEVFTSNELFGYLDQNMISSSKTPYELISCDSLVETEFAKKLEENEKVKTFAKLPKSFSINTPLGKYTPDWAILMENSDKVRLYFIVETKGSINWIEHKPIETAKIKCGKVHFASLENEVEFRLADSFDYFIQSVLKE